MEAMVWCGNRFHWLKIMFVHHLRNHIGGGKLSLTLRVVHKFSQILRLSSPISPRVMTFLSQFLWPTWIDRNFTLVNYDAYILLLNLKILEINILFSLNLKRLRLDKVKLMIISRRRFLISSFNEAFLDLPLLLSLKNNSNARQKGKLSIPQRVKF